MAVIIKLNSAGVEALLKSPEVLADLQRRAQRIAAAAGPGHETSSSIGRNRARASVHTETFQAMYNEAVHKSLTRAIDAGR